MNSQQFTLQGGQFHHQQQHVQQSYQQQYSYPQYANYSVPPPPPPPPHPPLAPNVFNRNFNAHNNNNNISNNNNHFNGNKNANGPSKNNKGKQHEQNNKSNANSDVAESLRQSLESTSNNGNTKTPNNDINNNQKNKNSPKTGSNIQSKINPKMAKKYSGQGLKSITVSGPGMPTQKFKICVGNHPDDIKKWIEERKKRFPRTSTAAAATAAATAGGVTTVKNNAVADEGVVEKDGGTTKKRSTDEMEASENCNSLQKDDLGHKRQCQKNKTNEESKAGALSSLLSGYDSSSSQEDNSKTKSAKENEENTLATLTVDHQAHLPPATSAAATPTTSDTRKPEQQRLCTFYKRGKCRHGTSCKFLHSDAPHEDIAKTANPQREAKRKAQSERDRTRINREHELRVLGLVAPSNGSGGAKTGGKFVNSNSLLHKLLQRDKERERRLALQLLRHIVNCDFFQCDKTGDTSNVEVTAGESVADVKDKNAVEEEDAQAEKETNDN